MKTYRYIFIFLIFESLISCKHEQIKFSQSQWNMRNDIDYNHREFMIQDLQKNYLKKGMKFIEVEKLLGENQYEPESDSIQLQYEIYTNYGNDIDPVETKTLFVNFNADSTLVNTRIDHWNK